MKTTRSQASKRLFKKLSALRATLSNEEREILDSLIVTEDVTAEVTAHKLFKNKVTSTKVKTAKVEGHKLTKNKVTSPKVQEPKFRIAFDPETEEYKVQD